MGSDAPTTFGDCLVFVDESGDHGLAAVNRDFPLFALAFCVFPKVAYADEVTPAVRRLKLATFGHDLVVLQRTRHPKEIRGVCDDEQGTARDVPRHVEPRNRGCALHAIGGGH